MNSKTHNTLHTTTKIFAATGLAAAASLSAFAGHPGEDSQTRMVYVTTDGPQSSNMEIRVENGKVSAKVNGKDVPEDRIHNDNGRITILDEHGQPMNTGIYSIGADATGSLGNDTYQKLLQWYSNGATQAQPAAEAPKVMIGISMAPIDAALAKQLNVKAEDVTFVSGVYEGLPAQQAGLEEYDVITKIDGKAPANAETVTETLASKNPNDGLTLTVIQNGKTREISIKVAAYDVKQLSSAKVIGRAATANAFPFSGTQMPDSWPAIPSIVYSPHENIVGFRPFNSTGSPQLNGVPMPPNANTNDMAEKMDRMSNRMAELEKKLQRLMDQLERQHP